MRVSISSWAAASIWFLVAACSDSSSTPDPSNAGNAGSGGSAGLGGSAGTQPAGGASGSPSDGGAGGAPDAGDAGAPVFQATLNGDTVHVVALRDVWVQNCEGDVQSGRQVAGEWMPLRDERPRGINQTLATHYVDGELKANCRPSLGCDSSSCWSISTGEDLDQLTIDVGYHPLPAREFTLAGELDAPSCELLDTLDAGLAPPDAASDAGVQRVAAIQSSVPSALDVRIRYHLGPGCSTPLFTEIHSIE